MRRERPRDAIAELQRCEHERARDGERRRVWVNFGPDAVALPAGWTAALRSDAGDGPLPADAAAILAPPAA